MSRRNFILIVVAFAWSAGAARAGEDDKVFRQISANETEALLKSLKIDFKKVPAKRDDVIYFDFLRQGKEVRLSWFGGKDLMLDAVFPKMSLQQLNSWNTRAKFSRACLHKEEKGEFTALESNLDLLGGITLGTVRQFLNTFDEEVKQFSEFVAGTSVEEAIFTKISADKLEGLLKDIKLEFKKVETKAGVAYDFDSNGHKLRLMNFGGNDLMIDAHFKKMPLEDVNKYNTERKFIRCVAYKVDGKEYTALELNLDCTGGVSDNIIRHFLRTFDEEVAEFTKYAKGK